MESHICHRRDIDFPSHIRRSPSVRSHYCWREASSRIQVEQSYCFSIRVFLRELNNSHEVEFGLLFLGAFVFIIQFSTRRRREFMSKDHPVSRNSASTRVSVARVMPITSFLAREFFL